jgi:VIT1/CCC1 family predicted Fe2+/Mn2+ transporter
MSIVNSSTTLQPSTELSSEDRSALVRDKQAVGAKHSQKLNWLRAGVLGANDGVVSIAGLVMGVAGATSDRGPIFVAGIAGIVAGALSMAVGEYVSVSTQRDSEKALLNIKRAELEADPQGELDNLAHLYMEKGLDEKTAHDVAVQLTTKDPLRAHADADLGIDPDELTSPLAAGLSSLLAFAVGAMIPLLAILLPGPDLRVPVTLVAVVLTLAITGFASAKVGLAKPFPAVLRNMAGGSIAMAITYVVGGMIGHNL